MAKQSGGMSKESRSWTATIPSSVSCAVMGLWLSNSGHGVEEVEQNSRGKDNEWM